MNAGRSLVKLARPALQMQAKRSYTPPERIKELQKMFTANDGVPVHLKKGALDQMMYQFTLGGCTVGLCYVFYTIYNLAFPKKIK